jgi:Arc/MetJ-type ribon-helix-helix transcriptional regulator
MDNKGRVTRETGATEYCRHNSRISLRLPEDAIVKLELIAKDKGVSVSEVVRASILMLTNQLTDDDFNALREGEDCENTNQIFEHEENRYKDDKLVYRRTTRDVYEYSNCSMDDDYWNY